MDAETRHQLKTNELGEALSKVDLNDRRLWGVIGVLAVVLASYAGWKIWRQQASTGLARQWATLNTIQTDPSLGAAPLDQMRNLIANATDANLAATARLRLGVALENLGIDTNDRSRFDEAARELQAVVDSGAPASLRAAALYRLACVQESRRDFAAARAAYERLTGTADFADLPFHTLAQTRLSTLAGLDANFEFQPGTPPPSPSELVTPLAPPLIEEAAPAPEADAIHEEAGDESPAGDSAEAVDPAPADEAAPPPSDESAADTDTDETPADDADEATAAQP